MLKINLIYLLNLVLTSLVFEQVLTCGEVKAAAATFSGPPNKKFLVIHWKAPTVDLPKTFKFLFTVVQEENLLWVKNAANSDIKVIPVNDVKASRLYVLVFPSKI